MNYAEGGYYSNYQNDPNYYGQQQQQQQEVEEDNTIDFRPPDISEQQDKIIQLVAKYVVFSCDGARYQNELIKKTKHNSYFDFFSTEHKYHEYYQYLIRSYSLWRDYAASTAVDQGNTDDGYAFYTEQVRQQEQQQQLQYQSNLYHSTLINTNASYTNSTSADPATTMSGYYDANSTYPPNQQQIQSQQQQQNVSVFGVSTTEDISHGVDDNNRKRNRSATPQESSDDEDDEDEGQELEFVIENGVTRAVRK